ncbi:MAG TPA: RNA methyltransferase [Verrucomicrobiae bacterium]|nr:RNA methyltransferase [Verrucomicrobiae bacterium]
MSQELKERVAVVLVEPQNPGNIGMVCRAMRNMGLSDLRIVKGCRVDHPEAVKFAVSARDMLGSARRFETLEEALADTEISVATTRRHGKYRQEILTPEEVARHLDTRLSACRAAVVFGREDSGLTTEEVSLCTIHSTIPTGDEFGSLNLAQAVLIYCYALFRGLTGEEPAEPRVPAPVSETEPLYGQMEETLLRIGFLNPENPGHLMRSLRRIFSRAELDSREVAIFRGMMTQIDWASQSFDGRKRR